MGLFCHYYTILHIRIAAYGDFDGDKYNDIFSVNRLNGEWIFHVHIYYPSRNAFQEEEIFRMKRKDCGDIMGLIPIDWNRDCQMDLIVKCKTDAVHSAVILSQVKGQLKYSHRTGSSSVELMVGDFSVTELLTSLDIWMVKVVNTFKEAKLKVG